MNKKIINLNSENIQNYEIQIKNDILIQHTDKQNILNCNNIYYEELKEDGKEKIINLFFFLYEKESYKTTNKIEKCIILLNEKIIKQSINKEKKQIKIIDEKAKRDIIIYKKFTLSTQISENKKQQKTSSNLYYINFPLAIKTTNYYNFLINFNEEYKIKFGDELFNIQIFNKFDEITYKNKTFILPLPYFIYPKNKNDDKPYIYYPYFLKHQNINENLIKKLKDGNKKEQTDILHEIYKLYSYTLKDSLYYKKYKSTNYKPIDIIINDYENELEESDDDEISEDLEEETEEETEEENNKENEKIEDNKKEINKGENIINYNNYIYKDNFHDNYISVDKDKYIDILEIQIKYLQEIKTTMDRYNFKTYKDIIDKINEMEKEKKYVLNLFNK